MSSKDQDQTGTVRLESPWLRALLLVPAALALYLSWTAGRWCLGNTLAANPPEVEEVLAAARANPNDPAVRRGVEEVGRVLRAAERFAPDDPQVHFTLGVFALKTFAPEEFAEAVARYERAAALSPNDYRLWMELGRLRGQGGDDAGGERALRHAAELAPHYSMPHWYLGNLLLRAGRDQEAFAELRRAAAIDPTLHAQIFATLWSYFGGDVRAVAAAVGDSPEARARLVEHLLAQKRLDDALKLWGTFRPEERRGLAKAGGALVAALAATGQHRRAYEVYRESAPGGGREAAVGAISNGGFESEVGAPGASPLDWAIQTVPQAQVGLDARDPHSGARSLRVAFSAPGSFALGQFQQLVLAEPQTRYRLSYFVRTEELKSVSTLVVEVVDAAGRRLAAGPAAPPGTNGWQEVAVEFTTPPAGDAVAVRVVRAPCADESCPIFGKVWYDDFNLQRAGGGAPARAPKGH